MTPIARIAEKAGALGIIVSSMACAGCFPALASLGAAIGLGFLQQYESLFVLRIIPLFAVLAFLANALGWFAHRQWRRSLLGASGPAMVFAGAFFLFGSAWMRPLVYLGIVLMVGVSIWDLAWPANRRCGRGNCELPAKRGPGSNTKGETQ